MKIPSPVVRARGFTRWFCHDLWASHGGSPSPASSGRGGGLTRVGNEDPLTPTPLPWRGRGALPGGFAMICGQATAAPPRPHSVGEGAGG